MKERKGPKSYWQKTAAPDLSESRQQVGRLSRLRSTAAWAALSTQQLIKEAFTVCLLLMKVSEITKGTSSSAAERKQSFRTTCSPSSAPRARLSAINRYQTHPPPPPHVHGGGDERLFFFCFVVFFFSNSPLRWRTSALSSSPALQAASSLITLDYSRLRLV